MYNKTIGTFECNYDRTGVIVATINNCNICGELKEVIGMDSSEDEYGFGYICKDCILENLKSGKD